MVEKSNLISIILPVYNGGQFLAEAIESCLNQTYKNIELIIIDDSSTDNSLEIAKFYGKKDLRTKILSNKSNKKLPACLNIGHRYATGEFLTWTSDDNILKNNMLELLLKNIIETNADLIFSDYEVIEADGKYRRTHSFGPVSGLPFGSCIGASFLYKRKVFEKLSGYDEGLYTLEDYDFWLRGSLKFKFHHLDKALYCYRIHKNNITSTIHNDPDLKKLFRNKHIRVYEKISADLGWSESTVNLLCMIRGFKVWNWQFFKDNLTVFLIDLSKFQARVNANDKRSTLQKLDELLRNIIMSIPQDRVNILWLFFKRPGILLDPYYSKKSSLKIIKKLL